MKELIRRLERIEAAHRLGDRGLMFIVTLAEFDDADISGLLPADKFPGLERLPGESLEAMTDRAGAMLKGSEGVHLICASYGPPTLTGAAP